LTPTAGVSAGELGGGAEFVVRVDEDQPLNVIGFRDAEHAADHGSGSSRHSTSAVVGPAVSCRLFQPAVGRDDRSIGGLGLLAMTRHSEFLYYQF
jgi:hypothetical protein